jgi:hypothetical protein
VGALPEPDKKEKGKGWKVKGIIQVARAVYPVYDIWMFSQNLIKRRRVKGGR